MDNQKVFLEVMKYISIAVGSVSGLIGAITETKDKRTGKPNIAGKWVIGTIVVSLIIGIASQAVEINVKNQEEKRSQNESHQQQLMLQDLRTKVGILVVYAENSAKVNTQVITTSEASTQVKNRAQENLADNPIFSIIPKGAVGSSRGLRALEVAIGELKAGAGEIGGNNRGPFVAKYLQSADLPEGQPWSAAFVSWCFSQVSGGPPFKPSGFGPDILKQFEDKGWLHKSSDGYKPNSGDVMWRLS